MAVSYGELAALIRRLAAGIAADVRIETIEALQEPAVEIALRFAQENAVAVFLSSGGNYRALSRHMKTGLLEITVTGFDFLTALKKASREGRKVAVVHYTMIESLDAITDILAVDVKQVTVEDYANIDQVLRGLKNEGIGAVIGGSLLCEKARKLGMAAYLVYSTESVKHALEAAVAMARTRFAEAQKAEELHAILDFTHAGVVAVDRNGIITALNPGAEKLLGIGRREAVGRPAAATVPGVALERVMASRRIELNQVETIGGARVIVNRIPIVIKEELTGALATIHDTGSIHKAEAKIREAQRQKGFRARTTFDEIIGDSPSIRRVKTRAALFARSDSAVLIHGESGTGKEMFAQAIHNASRRARHPFVVVNCAALPENLLESELFGYAEGAFTGARKGGKPGLFELAHQGTLFLDEIASTSVYFQAKLLRAIQEQEIMRIGADYVIPLDVRILSASNEDLLEKIREGSFRSDLYYRLGTLDIRIPPLRERRGDIVPLFRHFVERLARAKGKKAGEPGDRLAEALLNHPWPGNIRELSNVAEKYLILQEMDLDPAELLTGTGCGQTGAGLPGGDLKAIGEAAQMQVVGALLRDGAGLSAAARLLGISRTGLWKKIKRHEARSRDDR
jgi:propionate catabolism operon transcriptional regulator